MMSPIKTQRLGMAACLLIVSTTSRAEEWSAQNMLACAKLGADLERLSCYDRLSATLRAEASAAGKASTGTGSKAAQSTQAQSAQAQSPAAEEVTPALSAPELFGLTPNRPTSADVERAELKSITARIVTFRDTRGNGSTITLDNGQQWRQTGHEDLLLREGEKVVISRGAFASFWIVTEDNRSAHVKRLL